MNINLKFYTKTLNIYILQENKWQTNNTKIKRKNFQHKKQDTNKNND